MKVFMSFWHGPSSPGTISGPEEGHVLKREATGTPGRGGLPFRLAAEPPGKADPSSATLAA